MYIPSTRRDIQNDKHDYNKQPIRVSDGILSLFIPFRAPFSTRFVPSPLQSMGYCCAESMPRCNTMSYFGTAVHRLASRAPPLNTTARPRTSPEKNEMMPHRPLLSRCYVSPSGPEKIGAECRGVAGGTKTKTGAENRVGSSCRMRTASLSSGVGHERRRRSRATTSTSP